MTDLNKTHLNIRCTVQLKKELEEISKEMNVSVTDLVRVQMKEVIAQYKYDKEKLKYKHI